MDAMLVSAIFVLLGLWMLFWVIRLGVRYGVNDALKMNPGVLAPPRDEIARD